MHGNKHIIFSFMNAALLPCAMITLDVGSCLVYYTAVIIANMT